MVLFALFACDKKDDVVATSEPVKAAEPAKPAAPVNGTKPIEAVKPVEPVKPPTPTPMPPEVAPPTAVPSEPPAPPVAEDDFALMNSESFGDLKLDMTEADVKKVLPGAKRKGKCELSEVAGGTVRFLVDEAAGVQLVVSCEKTGDVGSFRVFSPSKLKTKRGIAIGDTADAVKKAYGDSLDSQSEPDENNIVAGSVYGGLGFTLTDGKVTQMFLGAIAE